MNIHKYKALKRKEVIIKGNYCRCLQLITRKQCSAIRGTYLVDLVETSERVVSDVG